MVLWIDFAFFSFLFYFYFLGSFCFILFYCVLLWLNSFFFFLLASFFFFLSISSINPLYWKETSISTLHKKKTINASWSNSSLLSTIYVLPIIYVSTLWYNGFYAQWKMNSKMVCNPINCLLLKEKFCFRFKQWLICLITRLYFHYESNCKNIEIWI